uniref:Uncharacterized protein n=1 Tax=Anguilla anguilla TaxID=7936 RepID=A0A0E9SMX0_ANGAN
MISDDLLMVDYLAEPFKIASQSFSLTLHVSLCGDKSFSKSLNSNQKPTINSI